MLIWLSEEACHHFVCGRVLDLQLNTFMWHFHDSHISKAASRKQVLICGTRKIIHHRKKKKKKTKFKYYNRSYAHMHTCTHQSSAARETEKEREFSTTHLVHWNQVLCFYCPYLYDLRHVHLHLSTVETIIAVTPSLKKKIQIFCQKTSRKETTQKI